MVVWVAFALFASYCVFRDPVQLGPDEGMEFAKMLLFSKEPSLVAQAWNDQPWFMSVVLAQVFKGSVLAAREFTVISVLLCGVVISWVSRGIGAGRWSIWFPLLFLTWTDVLPMCMNAMVEGPAWALTFCALMLFYFGLRQQTTWMVAVAAFMAAVGCGIKLTALMLGPSFLTCVIMVLAGSNRPKWSVLAKLVGISMVIFSISLYGILFSGPANSFVDLWLSHRQAAHLMPNSEKAQHSFGIMHFVQRPAILAAVLLGLWRMWRDRSSFLVCCGFVPLISSVLVHVWNRPFWFYYTLHFALPASILASAGIGYLFQWRPVESAHQSGDRVVFQWPLGRRIMLAALTSVWFAFELQDARIQTADLLHRQRCEDSDLQQILRSYAPKIHYGYSSQQVALARAEILQPPELTVVSKKRMWSGNISEAEVVDTVVKYDTEVLILLPDQFNSLGWSNVLALNYISRGEYNRGRLYVKRTLAPPAVESAATLLKRYRL